MLRSALAVAFACGLAAAAAAQPKTVLNVGMGASDAGTLDPHLSSGTPDLVLFPWMFNALARFRPGSMDPASIEPDIAESWQASADGRTWTFKLRRGVQCHRGWGELDADDVVYSLRRAADPKRSAFASDYDALDSVEAVDAATVRVSLKRPVPSLLGLVVNYHGGFVVCRKAAEQMGEQFKTGPIGTGPFAFGDYRPKESTTLVAHAEHFRGRPQLERIVYRYIPSDASRDLAFQAGDLDLSYGRSDRTWIERINALPGAVADVLDPAELALLIADVTRPPLDDRRVREAIALAIDRKALVAFRGDVIVREARSVVPFGYLGYSEDVPLAPHDPARAKRLLAEAGHPDGIAVKSIITNLSNGLTIAQVIQEQLRRAGIDLQLEVVEHATYHAQIRQNLSPIVYYSAARFPVADVYLKQFFHSSAIPGRPKAVTNFSHCALADREIDAADEATDDATRLLLWAEAQRKLVAEVCAIPLIEVRRAWARRASLDYGHTVVGSLSNGPVIDERTKFK